MQQDRTIRPHCRHLILSVQLHFNSATVSFTFICCEGDFISDTTGMPSRFNSIPSYEVVRVPRPSSLSFGGCSFSCSFCSISFSFSVVGFDSGCFVITALGEETGDFVAFLGEITPLGEAGSLRKVLLRLGISRRIPG